MVFPITELNADILVVGSGAAGTMAAIKAAANDANVLVATKGPFPSGNSSIAVGGYGAPLGIVDPRDNSQIYFEDVIRAGQGLCNEKVVNAWVSKISEITREMDRWGIDLIKENGKLSQIPWEGHTYPRMVHHYLKSGAAIMKCLGGRGKEMGFEILEHTIIGGLFLAERNISGAWGFQYQTGQLFFISAKTVIWATGGMGNLFPDSDNVKMATGEGYTIPFKIGAELTGMEFCNFVRAVCYPEEMRMNSMVVPLIYKLLKRGGARYYNNLGQRFMRQYFPQEGDLKSGNEEVIRAISREIYEERGSPHGGVYLDVSDVPEEFWKKEGMPIWEKATRANVNLTYQPLEIMTYPHYFIGGIKIDEKGRTAVSGLFAAGEAAGGAHGAARLGGSALSEALAFGAITGENAANLVKKLKKQPEIRAIQKREVNEHIQSLLERKSELSPAKIRVQIQQIVNKYINVAREEKGLNKALLELNEAENQLPQVTVWSEDIKKRNYSLAEAIEVEGQIELAKAIASAALVRAESREGVFGGHYRLDYPHRDDRNWLKNIILKREPGGLISHYTEKPVKLN